MGVFDRLLFYVYDVSTDSSVAFFRKLGVRGGGTVATEESVKEIHITITHQGCFTRLMPPDSVMTHFESGKSSRLN